MAWMNYSSIYYHQNTNNSSVYSLLTGNRHIWIQLPRRQMWRHPFGGVRNIHQSHFIRHWIHCALYFDNPELRSHLVLCMEKWQIPENCRSRASCILRLLLKSWRNGFLSRDHMKKVITKREIRTTWTLFMICFCYFLFVMPIVVVNIVDGSSERPAINLAFFCLYWLQYSLNFFVYAARSEQYRKAYVYFLRKVIVSYIKYWFFLDLQSIYLQSKEYLCGVPEPSSRTATATLYYVDKKLLPSILKNYYDAQVRKLK